MKITSLIIMTFFCSQVFAEQEVTVGYGMGMDSTLIQSSSISNANQWEASWSKKLDKSFNNDWGAWQWWLQAGYIHLQGHQNGMTEYLNIIEVKPILRWLPGQAQKGFFLEGGLGLSSLSKKQFETIRVQTKGNFTIHFGTGWKWSDQILMSLRYSHFSNGYTHTPNPGLDTLSLNLHWSF